MILKDSRGNEFVEIIDNFRHKEYNSIIST